MLYKIRQIRKFLSVETTKTLIHAFVTSHLDYCNSLLYGITEQQTARLQRILNAAARVVCLIPKFDHITPIIRRLHWLPVKARVEFKILLLTYKALHGLAPAYLSEMVELQRGSVYTLRSEGAALLIVPRTKCKTFGDRAFCRAAPHLWNQLPAYLRKVDSVASFKSMLKTHLFRRVFQSA